MIQMNPSFTLKLLPYTKQDFVHDDKVISQGKNFRMAVTRHLAQQPAQPLELFNLPLQIVYPSTPSFSARAQSKGPSSCRL